MGDLWKKLRGLAGVSVTWGAVWGVIGAGIGYVVGMVSPDAWIWANPILEWGLGMAMYGAVSGIAFGSLLSLREGRKNLFELSLGRVALWGLVGSATAPLVFGALGMFGAGTTLLDIAGAIAVTGFLGGLSAPAAVAIAKRAELEAPSEIDLLSS